jgi:hypothetical protein
LIALFETIFSNNLIIVGDFNTTIHHWEKRGGFSVHEHIEDLIPSLDLYDVKPSKGLFTWSNRRVGPGHIVAILDHFLINNAFLSEPFSPVSNILSCVSLDHNTISPVFINDHDLGPIPFQFIPLWLEHPTFRSLVASSWSSWIIGSPIYIKEKKLIRLKKAIKEWVKSSFKAPQEEIFLL